MKTTLVVALALAWAAGVALAQEQPKPGPEVQQLGYYVGKWEGHGETKMGPFGPAGKLSSKFTCEWFAGKFQVVCRGEETGPMGTQGFLNIKTYDVEAKAYVEYSISSMGDDEYDQGITRAGGKLTYVKTIGEGAKAVKIRYTEDHVSPTLLTYKAEASYNGAPYTVLAWGKIAKVK